MRLNINPPVATLGDVVRFCHEAARKINENEILPENATVEVIATPNGKHIEVLPQPGSGGGASTPDARYS